MSADNPQLQGKNLVKARQTLLMITEMLDTKKIPYHLEGGTLLGIVRDKELLPWDHDVDLSTPQAYATEILKCRFALIMKGYKVTVRRSKRDVGPIRKGQYTLIKIKPLLGYFIRWFIPRYKSFVVVDIFMKTSDETHTYWEAQDKVMRVDNRFYTTFETVEYAGKLLKAPNYYRDFLTEKYGNWQVPVKEWNCGENELTIYA